MDELKYLDNGNPKGGTLDLLLEFLIEQCEDTSLVDAFFAGGTYICTASDIWNCVERKYKFFSERNASEAGRAKVLHFLWRWIESDVQRDFLKYHRRRSSKRNNEPAPPVVDSDKPALYDNLLTFLRKLDPETANRYKLHILRSARHRSRRNERSKLKLRSNENGFGLSSSVQSLTLGGGNSLALNNSPGPSGTTLALGNSPNKRPQLQLSSPGATAAANKTFRSSNSALTLGVQNNGDTNNLLNMSLAAAAFAPEKTYEMGKVDLKILEPIDAARQMTLIEFDMFRRIQDTELQNLNWKKEDINVRTRLSPNVLNFVDRFNKVSFWVATEVVIQQELKERVNVIKKFVAIAEHMKEFGNFNGIMEIIGGLNSFAVQRLQQTWAQIPQRTMSDLDALNALMDNKQNYKEYRTALKNQRLPVLPYFGVYLRDIFFIEEGNTDYIGDKKDKVINFIKIQLLGEVLLQMRKQQEVSFPFERNDALASYFKKLNTMPEEELYKRSVDCEANPSTNASGANSSNNSSSSYSSVSTDGAGSTV